MSAIPPRYKPVIGLLGGIGSGKSKVAGMFASLGCGVIDADDLARQALQEPEVRRQVVAWWGPRILESSGAVDRKAVSGIVFSDAQELRRLEDLTHPRINQSRGLLRAAFEADPAIVAVIDDTPLLLEKGLDSACDCLVLVEASKATRISRLAAGRGWSEEELARREKNQLGLDIKAQCADYVISNDDGEADTLRQVRRVLSQILQDKA